MRPLLVLLALAGGLVLAWVLLGPSDSTAATPTERGAARPGAGAGTPAGLVQEESADQTPAESVVPSAQAREREAASTPATDAPDLDPAAGRLVRVLRVEDRTPLARARVTVNTNELFLPEDVLGLFAGELSIGDLLERDAAVYQTGARGEVHIAVPPSGGLVRASHGQRAVLQDVEPGVSEPLELLLAEASLRLVQVQLHDGTPAVRFPLDLELDGRTLFRVFTDDAGTADLSPALELSSGIFADAGTLLRVVAGAPLLEPAALEVDLAQPPPDPVPLLQLPPLGWAVLTVQGTDPAGRAPQVRFDRVPPDYDPDAPGNEPSPDPSQGLLQIARGDAPVRFPVGLGIHSRALAWQDFGDTPAQVVLPPPLSDGDELTGVLRLERAAPRLAFRVVEEGPDGATEPVAHAPLVVQLIRAGADGSELAQQRSDAAGRLEFAVREELAEVLPGASLLVIQRGVDQATRVGSATLPASGASLGQRIDLGDIRLEPSPALVAGRVQEADGRPVAGALVWAEARFAGQQSPERRPVSAPRRTDLQGRFRFDALHEVEDGAVYAQRSYFNLPTDRVVFASGQEDLVLTLPAAARLEGSLEGDPAVLASIEEQRLLLVTAAEGRQTAPSSLTLDGDRLQFVFEALDAGLANLTLRLRGSPEDLLLVEALELLPGASEQLGVLLLEGRVFLHRIRGLDADGRALEQGRIRLRAAGAPEFPASVVTLSDGLVEVLSTARRLDVWLGSTAPPIEDALAWNVAGEIALRVGPAGRLELTLGPDLTRLLEDPLVTLELVVDGTPLRQPATLASGSAVLPLPHLALSEGADVYAALVVTAPGGAASGSLHWLGAPIELPPGKTLHRAHLQGTADEVQSVRALLEEARR